VRVRRVRAPGRRALARFDPWMGRPLGTGFVSGAVGRGRRRAFVLRASARAGRRWGSVRRRRSRASTRLGRERSCWVHALRRPPGSDRLGAPTGVAEPYLARDARLRSGRGPSVRGRSMGERTGPAGRPGSDVGGDGAPVGGLAEPTGGVRRSGEARECSDPGPRSGPRGRRNPRRIRGLGGGRGPAALPSAGRSDRGRPGPSEVVRGRAGRAVPSIAGARRGPLGSWRAVATERGSPVRWRGLRGRGAGAGEEPEPEQVGDDGCGAAVRVTVRCA